MSKLIVPFFLLVVLSGCGKKPVDISAESDAQGSVAQSVPVSSSNSNDEVLEAEYTVNRGSVLGDTQKETFQKGEGAFLYSPDSNREREVYLASTVEEYQEAYAGGTIVGFFGKQEQYAKVDTWVKVAGFTESKLSNEQYRTVAVIKKPIGIQETINGKWSIPEAEWPKYYVPACYLHKKTHDAAFQEALRAAHGYQPIIGEGNRPASPRDDRPIRELEQSIESQKRR